MEKCLVPFELDKLTTTADDDAEGGARLMIHLGDVRDGKPDPITGEIRECEESLYSDIAETFERSPVPTFFIPGDNGWLDCSNVNEAYSFWEKHLFYFNERTDLGWPGLGASNGVHRWDSFPADVERTTTRSELFSFLLDSVLFIGLSLPGSGRSGGHNWDPIDELLADNVQWTQENFAAYADEMDAVVLFGHAYVSQNWAYYVNLRDIAQEYAETPIIFLEDGHSLEGEVFFLGVRNMVRLRQDDTVTPMKVTIHPSKNQGGGDFFAPDVFEYDVRCPCSTSHRPTELINYVDESDPCFGACTESHAQCANEETCSPEGFVCQDPLGDRLI